MQGQQEEFLSTLGAPRSTLSPWTHPHLSAFKELSFSIVCCPWCHRNHTEIRYFLQFYHTQRLAHPCCSGTLLFQPFSIQGKPYSAFILPRKKGNALKHSKCSFHPPHTTTTFLKASLSSFCQTSMSHRDIWLLYMATAVLGQCFVPTKHLAKSELPYNFIICLKSRKNSFLKNVKTIK